MISNWLFGISDQIRRSKGVESERLRKCRGRFRIHRYSIEAELDLIREVLGRVLIYRARFEDYIDTIYYDGMCEEFDEVSEGEEVPEYLIECQKRESGFSTAKFRRIK